MPSSRASEWNDASGSHAQLLRPDGSFKQWLNGMVVNEGGPDPDRAEAFSAGTFDAVAEEIRRGNELEASPYGQRLIKQEELLGQTAKLRGDQQYGLQQGQLDVNRGTLDLNRENTQFDNELNRDKFGLDVRSQAAREAELDRRFGLDSAKFGVDFFQTAANYGKTPKSWTDAIQYQSPKFMSNFAMGLSNPAFGAHGGTLPQMNSITDSVAASTGGGSLNAGLFDPAKNIQNILKGSPPSDGSGLTPQDIAAVRLIGEMYKSGGNKVKEGVWESYSQPQRDYLGSVMNQIAPNGAADFEQEIARSRIPGKSNPWAAV